MLLKVAAGTGTAAKPVPQNVTKVTLSLLSPTNSRISSSMISPLTCQLCRNLCYTWARFNDVKRFCSKGSYNWTTQSYFFTWSRRLLWNHSQGNAHSRPYPNVASEPIARLLSSSSDNRRKKLAASASKLQKKMRDTFNSRKPKFTARKKLLPSTLPSYKKLKEAYSDKEVLDSGVDLSKLTLYERMKFLLSHYGKVFIPLHYVVLSLFWFSSAYGVVYMGFDMMPYLEMLPEELRSKLHLEKLGEHKKTGMLIQAVALYKILTPLRYLSSVTATAYVVRYLRRRGYFVTPPTVREAVKETYSEKKLSVIARLGKRKWRTRFQKKTTKKKGP